MPRATPILTSFLSGETSPKTDGRVDLDGYYKACHTLKNMLVHIQGPAGKRPGTKYIGSVKTAANFTRVIPFEYSAGDSYVLELGQYYMRFYTDGGQLQDGGSPYEIVTPWESVDLITLRFVQMADVMYFAHPLYPVYKLSRLGATNWTLTAVDFAWGPFMDQNTDEYIRLVPSAISGSGIDLKTEDIIENGTFDSDISGWDDRSDAGGAIAWNGTYKYMDIHGNGTTDFGWAEQDIGVSPGTTYTLTFDALNVTSYELQLLIGTSSKGQDILSDSVMVGSKSYDFTVPAGVTTVYIGFRNLELNDVSVDNVTCKANLFNSGHVGSQWKLVDDYTLSGDLTAINQTVGNMEVNTGESMILSLSGTWVATMELQRSYDDGSTWLTYVAYTANVTAEIVGLEDDVLYRWKCTAYTSGTITARLTKRNEAGYVKITAVTDSTYATADVVETLASTDATYKWSEGAFSDHRGYPAAIRFYEQRLLLAGTEYRPSTIWGSCVDDYESHETGTTDAHAYRYTLAGSEVNQILWMVDHKILHLGTMGDEWKFGFADEPTTNSNVDAKKETAFGSEPLQAISTQNSTIFIEDGGNAIRAISYDFYEDSYLSPRISEHAEHLFTEFSGVWDVAIQEKPFPVIWLVMTSGDVVACTYDRYSKIAAFTRQDFGGVVNSVAVIRGDDRDEVWFTIQRTINSQSVRYIEQLQGDNWDDIEDGFYIDSGLSYSGAPAATFSGIGHLEGETVKVLADGAIHPDCIVSGGQITLGRTASKVHAGLSYQALLKTKRLELKSGAGTSQGKEKAIFNVVVRLYKSLCCKLGPDENNLDSIIFRTTKTPLGEAPDIFSGDKELPFKNRGSKDAYIVIASDDPVPLVIASISPTMYSSEL